MAPEAGHIKITNGRICSYLNNKVDTFKALAFFKTFICPTIHENISWGL